VGLNGLLLQGSTPVDLSGSHYLAAARGSASTGGTASAGGAGGEGKRTLAGLLHLGSMHSTHSTSTSSSGNGNGNSGVQEEDWVKIHWSGSDEGASGAGASAVANASDTGSSPRNPPAPVSVYVAVSVPVSVPTRAVPPVANCKSLFSPCKYEVSFESKDEMNDWMDAIDECREVCFLP
jgi:hypothetical protein